MKIKIALLTIITLIVTIFSVSLTYAKAESKDVGYQYLSKEYVESEIIVNVSDEIVPFLYDIGIDVKDKPETSGWFIWKKTIHHYYYITNEYVNYKITSRNLTKDIDSIIYMVKQLEYYADDFRTKNPNLKEESSELVLTYLRSINKNYTAYSDEYGMTKYAFEFVCGSSYNHLFRDFVNENEYSKVSDNLPDTYLTIPGYFASFISINDINDMYKNNKNSIKTMDKKIKLYDPLGSGHQFDLIHLFCTIDGCNYYDRTIGSLRRECGDMISWAGDLQTASTIIDISTINNFRTILNSIDYKFDWADFLADIDGYNIGYNLLKSKYNNLLSVALSGYYGRSQNGALLMTGKARYKLFINSIGVVNYNQKDSGMSEFKTRIGYAMNIDPYDFQMIEYESAKPYKILYEHYGKPALETRVTLAKMFFDFVCIQAEYDNRGVKGKYEENNNNNSNLYNISI